ncbi:hypothetical protein H5410_051833 [Solanum commersonii]|uniref:Uncharacterized protein n=1 Tax=Solanum commersonii TaxID=4109 RepID=A0A9J5X1W1_SOLCO|nr:hypothetical protein H5410_051833 [Solanum commersonii]
MESEAVQGDGLSSSNNLGNHADIFGARPKDNFSFQVGMNYQYKKPACEVDDNCCASLPSKY